MVSQAIKLRGAVERLGVRQPSQCEACREQIGSDDGGEPLVEQRSLERGDGLAEFARVGGLGEMVLQCLGGASERRPAKRLQPAIDKRLGNPAQLDFDGLAGR